MHDFYACHMTSQVPTNMNSCSTASDDLTILKYYLCFSMIYPFTVASKTKKMKRKVGGCNKKVDKVGERVCGYV